MFSSYNISIGSFNVALTPQKIILTSNLTTIIRKQIKRTDERRDVLYIPD